VYWSLSLEEQFYWVFPFLVLLLRRNALIVALALLAAVQIVIPRPNSFLSEDPSLLWLVRTDAICLGILLAVVERSGTRVRLPRLLSGWATAGLLIVLATAAAPAFALGRATGILALASAGLVWLARSDRGLILPRTRLDPLILWVGSRSYSLYLIHTVASRVAWSLRDRVISAVPAFGATGGMLLGLALSLGLLGLLAEANFQLVERPLRDLGRRISRSASSRSTGSEVEVAGAHHVARRSSLGAEQVLVEPESERDNRQCGVAMPPGWENRAAGDV
jgi:peptidoglycan/LPS O-acetylase OafA/YrhL